MTAVTHKHDAFYFSVRYNFSVHILEVSNQREKMLILFSNVKKKKHYHRVSNSTKANI
jgi:hypothetical protein